GAMVVEAEHVQRATEGKPAPDADGQVEHLGVGVARAQARVKRVVECLVRERETFRVLNRQSFTIRERRKRRMIGDVLVLVLGDAAFGARRRPPLLADQTAVDLRDAHAGELALAYWDDALVVDRV